MTIRGRLLAGHLLVAALVVVPALGAMVWLGAIAAWTQEGLQIGLEDLSRLDRFREEFNNEVDRIDQVMKVAQISNDPRYAEEHATPKVEPLLRRWETVRSQFEPLGRRREQWDLDALLGRPPTRAQQIASHSGGKPREGSGTELLPADSGESGSVPAAEDDTGAKTGTPSEPKSGTPSEIESGAPSGTEAVHPANASEDASATTSTGEAGEALARGKPPLWTDEAIDQARTDIAAVYADAVARLLKESARAKSEASAGVRLSVAALGIAVLLAVLSTLLAIRSLEHPLRRLASATMAVSAGKYGIAVPVRGGDDDLRRLIEAFNKMSENLATFERMKADFLSIAAHELRTPLTCIKGYVTALRATLPDETLANERTGRYLERIDHEADLMTAQVTELLTFGLMEAGQLRLEPREIPIEGFLVMAGEAFKPIASERKIEFRMQFSNLPSTIVGDPDRLNQVLMNLLDNAFKYTPAGGHVMLWGATVLGEVEITVTDSCPGIPADKLGIIFEKYARVRNAENRQKGTGLGLAVAKGIVTAHGGTIAATSAPGQGCRFTVRLPLHTGARGAAAEVA